MSTIHRTPRENPKSPEMTRGEKVFLVAGLAAYCGLLALAIALT